MSSVRLHRALRIQQTEVSGDTALVVCARRDRIETEDGQRIDNETRATFQLRRQGSSWVIASIR